MIRRAGQGVAAAAVVIGAVTVLARVVGFAKQLVLARVVGTNCLTTAYFTANGLPNIVFEIVAGGALAGMVVPVIAGASRDGRPDPETSGRIASALLTWVVVLLVPLAALTALAAGPLVALFAGDVPGCDPGAFAGVATRMLVVFAPQIPLYGVAVVLYGVLQAHRRFVGPAVAPLVSSLVVIAAYLAYVPFGGGTGADPLGLPRPAELALSVGTTLGVLALVVTVIGPSSRLGLRLRPTLRFPGGVARQVRALALAGLAALVAQQVATALVIWLANHRAGGGALAGYNFAWAIYQVPYAVLAVPIATSAFPALAARAGDPEGFAALAARTTRAVLLVSGLAAGVLAAVAAPVAAVFVEGLAGGARATVPAGELAWAIALFAPGLLGYGLIAHLSRVLYATGQGRAAAAGTVGGWLVAMAAQAVLTVVLPGPWRLAGLALGGTIGMTAGGALLLAVVARSRGGVALAGAGRAGAAAVLGGAAGFLAGHLVAAALRVHGPVVNAGVAALAGVVAAVAALAVAALADRQDLAGLLARRGGSGDGRPKVPAPAGAGGERGDADG
ncbi:membrane protein [Sphaerisporangium krabiense]|uniref:Putative peptidoglycan lipid II flippase n=1 Tax=Sphaerisporangium krabiense TaxID=763782 RepID=A0A7W8ZBN3_9ACTN|nr:lipid II flippase MurJ [Sphaerisporangium krabiense]MBB5630941.1 putative peptidoglycan lipid II flippase [Sphaerisporangium krabiense]GII65821.1 membrane protein [Sphaerisporangium krabiense]